MIRSETEKILPSSTAVPLPLLLDAYRDFGGPRDSGDQDRISCDPTFNRFAVLWVTGVTLDALLYLLDCIFYGASEGRFRRFAEEREKSIRNFLKRCFDERQATFQTVPESAAPHLSGIYAWHSAFGIMKALENRGCPKSLGLENFQKAMSSIGLKGDPHACLTRNLREAYLESPSRGAFVNNPAHNLPPTVTGIYTVLSILRNLYSDEQRVRLAFDQEIGDRGQTILFIRKCLKHADLHRSKAGFSIHPFIEQPCVNTTFFALMALEMLGEPLDRRGSDSLVRFVNDNYKESEGGFSSQPFERASMNATYFGIKVLDRLLGKEKASQQLVRQTPQILGFIQRCQRRNGGISFSDRSQFVENCLATRYALQIIQSIEKAHPEKGMSRSVNDRIRLIRKRAVDFCEKQYDPQTGGARCYPKDRIHFEGGELTVGQIVDYLDLKDERLRENLLRPRTRTTHSGRTIVDFERFRSDPRVRQIFGLQG